MYNGFLFFFPKSKISPQTCLEMLNSIEPQHDLEEDLDCSIDHTHPPAEEGEEREDELNEVVGQRLEAMNPPRGAMHVVGQGVWNWLGL